MKAITNGGLTARQVKQSREKYGDNHLTRRKKRGFFSQLLEAFGDPIIKILLLALAINVVFLCRGNSWFETAGIAVAIFLATFVSTLSEYGSEAAFERLQADAADIKCRVQRAEGIIELPIGDIVAGDLILLSAGERVPADGILVEGEAQVDQSSLTGESREVYKSAGKSDISSWDLSNSHQVFRGSVLSSGHAVMRAERMGDKSFYGGMAQKMQDSTRESPLKVRLGGLAASISKLGYLAALLVAAADLFQSLIMQGGLQAGGGALFAHLLHAATLAITVVVVAVPEGLPMMITVVLSSNMLRMLRDKVLVRKLTGIETSGSLNILFTDKTGTLTRGDMAANRFIAGDGTEFESADALRRSPVLWELCQLACGLGSECTLSGNRVLGGNATDRALLRWVLPLSSRTASYEVTERLAFHSARKFSAVRIKGARQVTLLRGAPERILPRCTRYYDKNGAAVPLTGRQKLDKAILQHTRNAARVLAIAATDRRITENGEFSGLILIGLVCLKDDIRSETPAAVHQITGAGIQLVMITGDNKQTAEAIAREAGLLSGQEGEVLTSREIAVMTDESLKKALPRLRVIARALPEDKVRLVEAAQSMGLVAGMTGDGINDAPALKKADVGFAMGGGTEVAKEAGDIVILDNNLSSIAKAILYGRTIFKSIRKFIVFQLTMNLCAVGVSILGPMLGVDTPVTVMQMLWINMIMDTLAGLAFAGEPALPEYMKEKPKRRDEPVLSAYMKGQIAFMGLYTIVLCSVFLSADSIQQWFRGRTDPLYFMTAFFALFIFSGVFNSFNARTHRLNPTAHLAHNPLFVVIMLLVTIVQIGLIYYGGALFRTAGLTLRELAAVLLLSSSVIPVNILWKLLLKCRKQERNF